MSKINVLSRWFSILATMPLPYKNSSLISFFKLWIEKKLRIETIYVQVYYVDQINSPSET